MLLSEPSSWVTAGAGLVTMIIGPSRRAQSQHRADLANMVGHSLLARRVVGQHRDRQVQLSGDEANQRIQVHAKLRPDLIQREARMPEQRELAVFALIVADDMT
jgi:hypothetical protein